jgi:hypothetical protein
MKILLDECVDWRLLRDLNAYEVRTVKQAGLEKIKNGALLRRVAGSFDVFVTVDSNLPFQQNPAALEITVIILRGRTTRLRDLVELLPALHEMLARPLVNGFMVLDWRER